MMDRITVTNVQWVVTPHILDLHNARVVHRVNSKISLVWEGVRNAM